MRGSFGSLPTPVAVLLAAGVAGCGAFASSENALVLDYAPVERRTLEVRADASGTIQPVKMVEVQSKAGGEVVRIHVETGDFVSRGTLLAEIDPREVTNSLAQAEADLRIAEARLNSSRTQLQRNQELYQANIITRQELESAILDEANASAQLVKAQFALDLARERMNDVAIRAPLDGVIIQRLVEEGAIIQSATSSVSAGTTLMTMADLSEMEVRTLIDETDIGRIQADQRVRVTVEAHPGRSFEGRVLKIEPQAVVEQNVTMFPVLVRLDNRDGLLKPGMNAEVQIEIARRENVVAVPNSAVVVERNAVAAGALLGISEQAVNEALRGPQGGGQQRPPAPPPVASAEDEGEPAAAPEAPAAMSEACTALMARAQEVGFQALSEEERAQMRECAPQGQGQGQGQRGFAGRGGRGGGGRGGRGGGGGDSGIVERSTALVFVLGEDGPKPRRVTLGLSDWDYAEVIEGLEVGEQVVLMSVAQIQQQQQQMMERMRGNSGLIPTGPPRGGGPGGGFGGPGGGRRGG